MLDATQENPELLVWPNITGFPVHGVECGLALPHPIAVYAI